MRWLASIPPRSAPYLPFSCSYVVSMRSKLACGCQPYCSGNCGESTCPGVMCGAPGFAGGCPAGETCSQDSNGVQYCCKPDCRGRVCGGNGCGGACGFCVSGYNCNSWQQCIANKISQSPEPQLPTVTRSTTSNADVFASWIGGIVSAGMVTAGYGYFRAVRERLYAPLMGGSAV